MRRLQAMLADTRPLRIPTFRRLWTANIITVIGAQLTVVAVPAQIYKDTGSSAYVGLTGLFGLVPLIIFGLYGGALADAFNRRTILMFTTVGLIATSALFWLQSALGNTNVWVLLVLFAVQQAFFGVNQPTRGAVLPKIVPADLLPAANSLNYTVMMLGGIAGPLLAGVLIPIMGYSLMYLIDTITLFSTLWAVFGLPHLPVEGGIVNPGIRSVIEGFTYLATKPVLMMSFVVDLIAMVFGMPRALFPEIAAVNFKGPAEGGMAFALLFAAIPIGSALGGIFSGPFSRVRAQGKAVVICVVVWGAAITAFGLSVWSPAAAPVFFLILAVSFLAVGGAADMFSAAMRTSMLQTAADDAVRGRLQGVFLVVVAGGPRIADTLHGAVAAPLGAAATATLGGILVMVLVIVAAVLVPSFWRYRLEPAASDA